MFIRTILSVSARFFRRDVALRVLPNEREIVAPDISRGERLAICRNDDSCIVHLPLASARGFSLFRHPVPGHGVQSILADKRPSDDSYNQSVPFSWYAFSVRAIVKR